MSFTSRQNSFLIGQGTVITGGLVKLDEQPTLASDGWDTLTLLYAQRIPSCTPEELAVKFPIGARLGSRAWWITEAKMQKPAEGFHLFEVTCKGWAMLKPAKITVGSAADQQSAKDIRAPQSVGDSVGAVFATVQTHENMPTMSVTYLVDNAAANLQTSNVGKPLTPPVSISVPDTVWASLTEYVYHWPHGWVLMGSEQDRLPGSNAAQITDTYKFIRDKTPG